MFLLNFPDIGRTARALIVYNIRGGRSSYIMPENFKKIIKKMGPLFLLSLGRAPPNAVLVAIGPTPQPLRGWA